MNIFDLWDRKICNVGQFTCFVIVVVVVAVLVFVGMREKPTGHAEALLEEQREQQVLETNQKIAEILGEEWLGVQSGDLIEFEDGTIYVLDQIFPESLTIRTGENSLPLVRRNKLIAGKVKLFKQQTPEYNEKARLFILQIVD